jgi:hypothetical protein
LKKGKEKGRREEGGRGGRREMRSSAEESSDITVISNGTNILNVSSPIARI